MLCECHFFLHNSLICHLVPDVYIDDVKEYTLYDEDDNKNDKNKESNIEEVEVGNLKTDSAANMPPKKKVALPSPLPQKRRWQM